MEHWLEASWHCDDQRVGAKHISDILAKGHTISLRSHARRGAAYSLWHRYPTQTRGENIVDDGFQFITAHKVAMFLACRLPSARLQARWPLGNFDWLCTAMLCGRKIAVTLVDICNCFRPWIMTQAWNGKQAVCCGSMSTQAEHLHSKITLRWQFTIVGTQRRGGNLGSDADRRTPATAVR